MPRKCSLFPRRRGLHIVRDDFFIKSHLSLIPSLLLSESNTLRWASIRFGCRPGNLYLESVHAFHVVADCISFATSFLCSASKTYPTLMGRARKKVDPPYGYDHTEDHFLNIIPTLNLLAANSLSKPFAGGKSTMDSRFSGTRRCSRLDGTE